MRPSAKLRPFACPVALALLSRGPHDVRPALLALYYADQRVELPSLLAYGLAYMREWCRRWGISATDRQLKVATAHGLLRLWRPVDAGHVDVRAREAGMRAVSFRVLTNQSLGMYRARLVEAAGDFMELAAGSESPGRAGTVLSPYAMFQWWRPGRPAECRLVDWKVEDIDAKPRSAGGWLPGFDWHARGPRPVRDAGVPQRADDDDPPPLGGGPEFQFDTLEAA